MLVPSGRWCDDPWVTSTALATTTRRLDFLLALSGLISPVIAARMVSALDRLSGGRACAPIVQRGPAQLAADGLHLDHDERYAMTDEWLTVLRRVFDRPEVSFKGRFVRVVSPLSVPLRAAAPAVYSACRARPGCGSPRHADMLLSWGELPEQVAGKITAARRLAAGWGHAALRPAHAYIVIRETEDEAWREADELIKYVDDDMIARQQSYYAGMDSVGQRRMSELRRPTRSAAHRPQPVGGRRADPRRLRHLAGRLAEQHRQAARAVRGARHRHAGAVGLSAPRGGISHRLLLFPALPRWSKPDPLLVPELRSIPAFVRPASRARWRAR